MRSVGAKVGDLTGRRFVGLPMEVVVANLNRVLRGWSAYFPQLPLGDSGQLILPVGGQILPG